MGWIYYLRFSNGKGYVGQTRYSVAKRLAKHRYDCGRGKTGAVYDAWRKYGEPLCVPLFSCPVVELNEQETLVIRALQTYAPSGYNLTTGGDTPAVVSIETREKQSRAATGRVFSVEHRQRLSEAHRGKPSPKKGVPMSAESRAKMSAAKLGVPVPLDRRARISRSMKAFRAGQNAPG